MKTEKNAARKVNYPPLRLKALKRGLAGRHVSS